MRNRCLLLLAALCVLLGGAGTARATLAGYTFSATTGKKIDLVKGATTLWTGTTNGGTYNGVSSASLPFNFNYDGISYSRISISLNGVVGLGSSNVPNTGSNSLSGYNQPIIAPWWDQLRIAGNYRGTCGTAQISYFTSGSAPDRIFVVDWQNVQTVQIGGSPSVSSFQLRLYEGSNKIEFYYGVLTSRDNCFNYGYLYGTSGSIGLGNGPSNFVSITPNGSSATKSSSSVNDYVYLPSNPVTNGTLYTFLPCNVAISGNTAQGGTATMANGDQILTGLQTQRGNTSSYQPYTLSNASTGCDTRTFTYSISGPSASEYRLSQTSGTLVVGSTSTPTIDFTPAGLGVRSATLTVRDDNGFTRTYTLAAQGSTRIQWIGNIAQGGTANANSGDTLMKTLVVRRNTTQTFTPLTIRNFNTNGAASAAPVTFTIVDTSGQFSMVAPASGSLVAGASFTPSIRFSPIRIGFQYATLTVTADGESRSYVLAAFGGGPGAEFLVNNTQLGSTVGLFTNSFGCVGEYANSQAVTIRSIGSDPFIMTGISFYQIDTNYGQGVPRYPLVRDRFGNPISRTDYFISRQPGTAPNLGDQNLALPDTIPAGQTRTYYITYVGQEPGKRFARAFIRSNSETFSNPNETSQPVLGLMSFDVFGRAIGGQLADNPTERTLRTMTFQEVRVGDSVDMTYRMYNTGDCNLRISFEKLAITAGDVNDFRLLTAFGRTIVEGVPMTGDAILAPDDTSSITVRFKPQRGGSRRATIWLQTNDSGHYDRGVAERGAYYLDLYGFGKAGLDYNNLALRPAVIGATSSDGVIRIVNSSVAPVAIQSFTLVGGDVADFSENAATYPWPTTLPYTVIPGGELMLGVRFTPTGAPGMRTTTLRLLTTTNETIDISIKGEAGSQGLSVSPGRLFVGNVTTIGEQSRAMVMISNTGTLPIMLNTPTITGAGAADYRLGALARRMVEPGTVEYLEVTYAPVNSGASVATLTIGSDAGTQTVSLEGTSPRTRGAEPTSIATGGGSNPLDLGDVPMFGTSAVRDAAAAAAGISFEAVRPNPARDRAELVFSLAKNADVRIELYDGAGRLVREVASGSRAAGEHRIGVDVSTLTAGVYHCRLSTGGVELSRNVVVVR